MNDPYYVTPCGDERLLQQQVVIGDLIAGKMGIKDGTIIKFFVGANNLRVRAAIVKGSNHLNFHPVVFETLRFSPEVYCGIHRDRAGIHLGPVVGVMADLTSDQDRPFGDQSYFISQLLEAGRIMGEISFAFSPNSVNYRRKAITGYQYTSLGWVKGIFPIPNVVYPRHRGYSPRRPRIRNKLEEMGCKFINPPLIGKWQTYKLLSQDRDLVRYIPDTRLIDNFKQVNQMINQYEAVYMKPVSGSKGENIVRVVKKKQSPHFDYQYQMNNQIYHGTAGNLKDLQQRLHRVMGKKSYIVQQRINLLCSQGSIIDVRILVQKDDTGKFSITGMACREGKEGSITSNISSGGKVRSIEWVLSQCFADSAKRSEIIRELHKLALGAAKRLDAKRPSIGEMGIDIGIDQEGRIWFIEANTKPGRQIFSLMGDTTTRLQSVEKPMKYARYLAGFAE